MLSGGTLGYKPIGDNIDFTVKARYMRSEGRQDQSLHFFHSYAIKDRIDLFKFSFQPSRIAKPIATRKLPLEMLPSLDDNATLSRNISTIVSRILVENLPFFRSTFSDVVTWHINHSHYEEMSKKSEVVSFNDVMPGIAL